jgi:hypothetical protein
MAETTETPTIEDLYHQWQGANAELDSLISKLRARGASGDEFETAISERLGSRHRWDVVLVEPIAKALERDVRFSRVEVLGPLGVGAMIFLYCYADDADQQPCATLVFCPDLGLDLGDCCLQKVDFNSDNGRFKPGTVGHINELHRDTIPVPMSTRVSDVSYWTQLLDWR